MSCLIQVIVILRLDVSFLSFKVKRNQSFISGTRSYFYIQQNLGLKLHLSPHGYLYAVSANRACSL